MASLSYLNKPRTMSQDEAIREAQKRFFVIGGHGLGLKFIDSKPERVASEGINSDLSLEGSTHGLYDNLTLWNVCDWMNANTDFAGKDDKAMTPRKLQYLKLNSVLPTEVYRVHKPLIMSSGHYYVRNGWRDTGVCIDKWRDRSEAEITEAAKHFTDLLTRCLGDNTERAEFFVDWLRTCIQKPASKPPTVPYTYGPGGQFKGEILKAVQQAFGEYTVKNVTRDSTLADKNAHEAFRSALTVVEEVRQDSHDGSTVYNAIKAYSTAARAFGEAKNAGQQYFDTPAGLWLQSNHPCPFLEDSDRRMWIVRWAIPELEDNRDDEVRAEKGRIFEALEKWKKDGGLAALRAYLELIPPQREFNDAPWTPEKLDALALSFDPLASQLEKRLDDPRLSKHVLFDHTSVHNLLGGTINPSRVSHLARDAGMYVTSANALAKAHDSTVNRGRFRVGGVDAFSGNDVMFFREGWSLAKRSGVWKLVHVDGDERPLSAASVSLQFEFVDIRPVDTRPL